jgi:formate-dependent nitrite reductase cytochrome c552 subunit
MRVAAGMARMTPADARLSMRREAHARELSCVSCHLDHEFDTRRAAVDACLGCHDDRHSRAYIGSPHHRLVTRAAVGDGTGVTCATCHLPRLTTRVDGSDIVTVQHNQNANLRPNEKMARTACMHCHGLGFSLDALADRALIAANFRGTPVRHVAGIEMAMKRMTARPN